MNSQKESPRVSTETADGQVKTPQRRRPRYSGPPGGMLFRNALAELVKQEKTPVVDKKEEFLAEQRKAALSTDVADDRNSKEMSSLENSQSSITNSSLENYNRKTNVKNNYSTSEETKPINREHAPSNYSNFDRGKVKGSYKNEHTANRIDNIEIPPKNVNVAYRRTQSESKQSFNEEIWDNANSDVAKCASSYPYGTSRPSIQSSSVNYSNAKVHDVDDSYSKSIKFQENRRSNIDLKENEKGSLDVEDSWDPIPETNSGSLGTNKINYINKHNNNDGHAAYRRSQSERKPSYNNDDWDNTNDKYASSYPHGNSESSIQSSSVNYSTKKFDAKARDADNSRSKAIKSEENSWSNIDLEGNAKGSIDVEDGWGPISETNSGSLGTNPNNYVDKPENDGNSASRRTQRERKLSHNTDNWDDKNVNITKSASSYPPGTSKNFIPSSAINQATKKVHEKVHGLNDSISKSKKVEGWPEIDSKGNEKLSIGAEDGWCPIPETDSSSLSKFSENKYEEPYQHRTSTQSLAVSNRPNQNSNSKENYKCSVSMPLAEPAPMNGRLRQDFSDKNNRQYNAASRSQPSSFTKQDFNSKNHYQKSNSTSTAQSSFTQKTTTKPYSNSWKTDEVRIEKKQGASRAENKGEAGWPNLDLPEDRRHSYKDGDGWGDVNREEELSGNRAMPYQRSISTPSDQSLTFASNKNWEGSRHNNEDGRGDCPTSFPRSDRSNFEQSKQFLSKSQLARSASFRDKTSFVEANIRAGNASNKNASRGNHQDSRSRPVDDFSASYSGNSKGKPNWQASPNHKDQKSFNRSTSQDSKMIGSNPNAIGARVCRENTDSQVDANRSSDSSSEPKMAGSILQKQRNNCNPNRSKTIPFQGKNSLKDKNKVVDSSDEWCTTSDTSDSETIVLEDDLDVGRRVIDPINMTITFSNRSPKKVPNPQDSKTSSPNSSAYKKIVDDELLQSQAYLDPLESFLHYCSEPVIPPPQPVEMVLGPVPSDEASNAVSLVEKLPSESNDSNSVTESEPHRRTVFSPVPDANQLKEITSFLKDLEAEKSMPLQLSDKIFDDVVHIIKYYTKGHYLHRYGSYVSGLAVSTSNLNLALKAEITLSNKFLNQLQKQLYKELDSKGYQVDPFEDDKDYKKSKVLLTERKTGITCEIVYFGSAVSDYRKMDKLLSDVCQFDTRIKTLLIATRIWAEVCLINEIEEGKLHNIGYTLLMLHFLQSLENPLLPIIDVENSKNWDLNPIEGKNDASIGELWLAFLQYYSREFNWDDTIVTIHSKTTVEKSSKSWQGSLIAIEDPFRQKNIAETVETTECAECIFSCFTASYQYFSKPVDYEGSESSDSGTTESQSNNLKKEIFTFNDISFSQNLPSFCEVCDKLNKPCGKCRPTKEAILQPLSALSPISLQCVNKALNEVYHEFILPDSKIKGREAFVRVLEKGVQSIYPDAKLTLFGSSVNGFGFKRSDLDICMTLGDRKISTTKSSAILLRLVRFLRGKQQIYDNVFGLYHAKIPIVKFHFITEDWNCDLSLCNVLAVHNSRLLCRYALFDERCRILGCAMKLLAKKSCLDDTRSLSSYSYILTVIHYLQQVEPPVLPVLPVENKQEFVKKLDISEKTLARNYWLKEDINELQQRYLPQPKNTSSVGELWLGFLDFYARYDGTNAVTITQKEPLLSKNLQRCARLLNIQDPFLEKDNLGCILTDKGADQTRKVLGRARLLFGKEISKDSQDDPKKYYFSSSNLTGQYIKEIECLGCGGFGHEKSDCIKADPFKYSKFKTRFHKPARQPHMQKV